MGMGFWCDWPLPLLYLSEIALKFSKNFSLIFEDFWTHILSEFFN